MHKFASVQMNNGEIFDGKEIEELIEFIINKFSEEKLSYDKAKIVLNRAMDIAGEYSKIQPIINP